MVGRQGERRQAPNGNDGRTLATNTEASRRPYQRRIPSRLSAVEELVQDIRGLIDKRGLGVGDRLPSERELCELFSTSRNTTREAMRILKAYGVVDVRPKVGAVITDRRMERVFDLFSFNTIEVSRKTFIDIQGFRSLIETASVDRLLDLAVETDIAELRAFNEAMRKAGDLDEASEQDYQFHLRLVSILANDAVREVYRIMKPVIVRIMVLGKTRKEFSKGTFEQHEAVVAALAARDRIAYQYAMQSHLNFGLENFGAIFSEIEDSAGKASAAKTAGDAS